ncbi:GyrI-like domain-containing protein [Candidatus Xianfuyuplasma coldseepsis]|uniref:GyrI-like small molecule binding domain-containing protein n=1 Tax=Candidatus Xianfuyuplasma coldseepsis TaxID=2782163 RepID=A0A7L7KRP5_9MOLU|nr:GyrI-like domain-containing protein [Xianfuyuplasma coldseepsis]QMS85377.1 hypothetical protein G4Z02_06295 [Xianfuyuplasma coldseepsis]
MKHEWRKHEKEIYMPKQKPTVLTIPPLPYITITGQGNPNSAEFSRVVEALYALSYGIKMAPKKGIVIDGYFDYTVYPLEGFWTLSDEGKARYTGEGVQDLKDFLAFKLMIRQPDFVTKDFFKKMQSRIYDSKKNPRILDAVFEVIAEKESVQMLHIGSYDDEVHSFQLMDDFCIENNFVRMSNDHKEIYLSDPRKVEESKLKTVLRFSIERR